MQLRPRAAAVSRADGGAAAKVVDVPARENQAVVTVLRSKRLSQGNEVLSSFDSRWRVQVVTHINAHRPHGRGIAQSHSERVCVLTVEANRPEYVSAIVKCYGAQTFLDRNRYSEFRVDDEQLIATRGNTDRRARTRIIGIAACGNRALRTSPVQRESAQRAPTAREELFANRNSASGERFLEAHAQAVRPDDLGGQLLVVRSLRQ